MEILNFIKVNVKFQEVDPPVTTPYVGTMLRGAFGHSLRKIFCIFNKRKSCKTCSVKEGCFYYKVFETPAPPDSPFSLNYSPHPFVISPTKPKLEKSPLLEFDFLLFGKFTNYYSYFVRTLKEMGSIGFGSKRSKSESLEIYDSDRLIFSSRKENFKEPTRRIFLLEKPTKLQEVEIELLTPLKISSKGKVVFPPDFQQVMRSVFRRISLLAYFFEEKRLNVNFKGLLEKAKEVSLVEWEGNQVKVRRYSTRKKEKMSLLGFQGRLKYKGDLGIFLPWLKAGEEFHIGKHISFGFGKFRLLSEGRST